MLCFNCAREMPDAETTCRHCNATVIRIEGDDLEAALMALAQLPPDALAAVRQAVAGKECATGDQEQPD